jgi:hypothetical protein
VLEAYYHDRHIVKYSALAISQATCDQVFCGGVQTRTANDFLSDK